MPHRRRFVLPPGFAASIFLRSVSHPPSAFHRLGHHCYPPYLTLSTQSKDQIRIWRAEHRMGTRNLISLSALPPVLPHAQSLRIVH